MSHSGLCCCNKPLGFKVLKLLIVLIILTAIFYVGVCLGAKGGFMDKGHRAYGSTKMMTFSAPSQMMAGGVVGVADSGCMKAEGVASPEFMMNKFFMGNEEGKNGMNQMEKLFGVIVKIENNLITVKDNSTNEQVIMSQAQTAIMSKTGEIGLSSLSVGQSIVSYGTYNTNKQLEAKFIESL